MTEEGRKQRQGRFLGGEDKGLEAATFNCCIRIREPQPSLSVSAGAVASNGRVLHPLRTRVQGRALERAVA